MTAQGTVTTHFIYDNSYQLRSQYDAKSQDYRYDDAGNLVREEVGGNAAPTVTNISPTITRRECK